MAQKESIKVMSKLFYNRKERMKEALKQVAEDQIQSASEGEWELDLDLNEHDVDEFSTAKEIPDSGPHH